MNLRIEINPELDRYQSGIERLSEGGAHKAYARALNRTIQSARTDVVRATVKQSSIPRRIVNAQVETQEIKPGSNADLEVSIKASGRPVSLKAFKPRQFRYGVRATIFGKKESFKGAFIYAGSYNSGKFVAHGHVFERTTAYSLPILKLYGPSVPEQIVRDEAKDAFERKVDTMLPNRIIHEVGRLLA